MIVIYLILIFIFLRWVFKENQGAVVLIFANIGAGKTTLLARYAQRELKKMKKGKSKYKAVISNTPISGCYYIPDVRTFIKETKCENVLYLVDEAGIVWNNRKMKITDDEIEYVKQIRHYKSKLIAISQSYDDVDITIRRLYTNVYILNKIFGLTLIRPIRKYVTIDKETEQIIDGYQFRMIFSWGVMFRFLYYRYFDTYFVPNGKRSFNMNEFEKVPYVEKKKKKLNKMKKEGWKKSWLKKIKLFICRYRLKSTKGLKHIRN